MSASENNPYEWVEFFEEMSTKLSCYQSKQKYLIELLRELDINLPEDQDPRGKVISLEVIDPFTFTSLITQHGPDRQKEICVQIKDKLEIEAEAPQYFTGIPRVRGPRRYFPCKFARDENDIGNLWALYSEVVNKKDITDDAFAKAENVAYAGHAKLTQGIFCAAPKTFLPINAQTIPYLKKLGFPYEFKTAEEYKRICKFAESHEKHPYIFSHIAYFSNKTSTDAEFQHKVQEYTKGYKEEGGPIAKPLPQANNGGATPRYNRKPEISRAALQIAKFKCEINKKHKTFVSRANEDAYVEAHHLIPISKQDDFNFSLDVLANVIALCPNCHRLLHHGKDKDKTDFLNTLFKAREAGLKEKGISLNEKNFLKIYKNDLLGDEG